MTKLLTSALLAGSLMIFASGSALAQDLVTADEWKIYKDGFVTEDGRVVDDANGNISHSESQGYGLILSQMAGDRESFDAIWKFAQDELAVRADSLFAWRWQPDVEPHVSDPNNASDGDILIAYGLALGGERWNDEDLTAAARRIAVDVARTSVITYDGRPLLLPAQYGFKPEEREDGPVINLSYWVFEAFPVLADLTPDIDWQGIADDGLDLIEAARFGDEMLPTDWVALGGVDPEPAKGFPPEFSFNSIRIPLYLLRAGETDPALLAPFGDYMSANAATVSLPTGKQMDPLEEPGYRIIGAAVQCVLKGESVPDGLKTFEKQSYYGSTLHLLTLSYLRASASQCL